MRVNTVALIAWAFPLLVIADGGEYCVIPKLTPGMPTTVPLEYIEKPFCGVALIDHHYVRLDDVIKAKDEGAIECAPNSTCTKTNRYYQDEQRTTPPYIIIFKGPKRKNV